jgi:pyruvate carboxylase subunit B
VVRQQAIGAEQMIDVRPADLLPDEMDTLQAAVGELASCEEDVLTCAMFPDIGREFLKHRQQGTLRPEPLLAPADTDTGTRSRPTEFNVTLHGEPYHIKITGTGHRTQDNRPFYMTVNGVPEEVLVETLDELPVDTAAKQETVQIKGSQRPRATQPGRVPTSMPGTTVEVLVKVDDEVTAGTPVLITEAMKMETEIQAPTTGRVTAIHVSKGDSVNPDETLIEINI